MMSLASRNFEFNRVLPAALSQQASLHGGGSPAVGFYSPQDGQGAPQN
jgi:hypothetical protein